MACIYGIVDLPTTYFVYVGATRRTPSRRLREHLRFAARGSSSHFHRWLRQRDFDTVDAFEIEQVASNDTWQEAERFWIAYFRSIGSPLKNVLVGGDGLEGLIRT